MMTWAEQRRSELGCYSVTVETMSFQAPGFYATLGYRRSSVAGLQGERLPPLLREGAYR